MPTERTCANCVFQKRGHCTLTAVAWNTVDNQCLHWGPRPPTNTLSSGNGDWTQTTDLTHGGSAPAEDWREPMVDTSNSSNPTEEHVGKHLLTGGLKPEDVEPDPRAIMAERDLLKQRVAELEAENERLRAALMPLETSSIASAVQDAAAATMQRDQLQAALELERRTVEALAEHIETACEGFSHGSMSAITVAPGGYMDAAEIAAWARNRARGESGE